MDSEKLRRLYKRITSLCRATIDFDNDRLRIQIDNMLQQKTVKALIATAVVVFGAAAYHGMSRADFDTKTWLDKVNQTMRSIEALEKYYPTRKPTKDFPSDKEQP